MDKHKLDDVFRRIDHHSFILRMTPIDFFKTSVLAQSGTLFAVLGLIINGAVKQGEIKSVGNNCQNILDNRKILSPSQFWTDDLKFSLKCIIIALSVGVFISTIGYAISYTIGRTSTKELRTYLNNFLFKGYSIEEIRSPPYHNLVSIFVAIAIVQIFCLLWVVSWFAEIAFDILK